MTSVQEVEESAATSAAPDVPDTASGAPREGAGGARGAWEGEDAEPEIMTGAGGGTVTGASSRGAAEGPPEEGAGPGGVAGGGGSVTQPHPERRRSPSFERLPFFGPSVEALRRAVFIKECGRGYIVFREAIDPLSSLTKAMSLPSVRQSFSALPLLAWAALAASGVLSRSAFPGGGEAVLPGIDVLLRDSMHLVRAKRVGLVTNQTGVDRKGAASIDRLAEAEGVSLVALFSPEHGIRGKAEAGVRVESGRDPKTGLPIHSLYGSTRKPTEEMLDGIDVLLFDIQDIGTRYYTYIYTMALAMEAAGERGVPFVVLDRPNPIGGERVQGNVLDPKFASFVGMYPIAMRHGMTPGELALLFRGEFGVKAELHVVPMRGWRRSMTFGDTGLPWIAPSPNMPSVESALHYPGLCLFEGTNLSVGRGTARPFQQVGAPWLDGEALAERLGTHALRGVRVEAATFVPDAPGDGKFDGETISGVRLTVVDADAYDPTAAAVATLVEARRLASERWKWRTEHFDRLAGTDRLREGIESGLAPDELRARWKAEREAFEERRRRYLIYEE